MAECGCLGVFFTLRGRRSAKATAAAAAPPLLPASYLPNKPKSSPLPSFTSPSQILPQIRKSTSPREVYTVAHGHSRSSLTETKSRLASSTRAADLSLPLPASPSTGSQLDRPAAKAGSSGPVVALKPMWSTPAVAASPGSRHGSRCVLRRVQSGVDPMENIPTISAQAHQLLTTGGLFPGGRVLYGRMSVCTPFPFVFLSGRMAPLFVRTRTGPPPAVSFLLSTWSHVGL